MADGYSPRCDRQRAPRRLPERIRLSLQSPHVGLPRETVLSTGSTGGSGRSGPVCNSDQTTTCWGWWRQVNIPKVDYTGWLTNGKKFDSSVGSGKPFDFMLGASQVIKGWDEGVAGMKVGGKRQLRIPPDLTYGPAAYPPSIPANS